MVASLALLLSLTVHSAAPTLPIESYRLANGLRVVLHRDAAIPRVSVVVAYHVGSKNESAGRTGFAHFFEHMMFRGTKYVPNYDLPLQEAGTSSNAFTTEDMTVYFETVPSNYLERAIYLEAERLAFLGTALDQAKFDTEREVVKNERRQSYENVPYGLAEETILAHLFPKGHPYSWSVIGSMRDLNAASLSDLTSFFNEFYHPGNAALCLSGDFDPAEARKWIERYFGPIPKGATPPVVKAAEVAPAAQRIVQHDRVQLSRVYWSWPAVAGDHPDAPALATLAAVLAQGEASRLHRALVVDERLAKDVSAGADDKEIAGLFTIQATVNQGRSIPSVEESLARQIARIQKENPLSDEMARAIAKFERTTLTSLTSPLGRGIILAIGASAKNDPEYYRKDYERRVNVSAEDVSRVARRYLVDQKMVLEIRPLDDKEKSEAILTGPLPGAPASIAPRSTPDAPQWSRVPNPSASKPFVPPRFVRQTLPNGLTVFVASWKTLPIVTARLVLPVGTADDPPGRAGLATLTASLLDKGTKELTATALAEKLESLGATPSVSADLDETTVELNVLARHFGEALSLVGQFVIQPRLDRSDVDRERLLQLAGLVQGPDSASWIAQRAFRSLLHGAAHPYGRPTDGDQESVAKLDGEAIRTFHSDHFSPRGSALVVAGDVDSVDVLALAGKIFGGWTAAGKEARSRPRPEVVVDPKVVYLADKPKAPQSVICVGRRGLGRRDERYAAAIIGNRVLGGDFLSRLNRNLREEHGYTYGAYTSFSFRREGSVWGLRTSVRTDATVAALKEIDHELTRFQREAPFKDEEIEINRVALARAYPEEFESPRGIVDALEDQFVHQLPADDLDTHLEKLMKASLASIRETTAAFGSGADQTRLIVGDRAAIESELKKAGYKVVLVDVDGRSIDPPSSR